MRALNCGYRRQEHATDVLSFSYEGEKDEGISFLGEIVICPHVAVQNAARWNTAPEKEIRRLLVHGILHLLGYDHETDSGEMSRLQACLVRRSWFRESASILGRG